MDKPTVGLPKGFSIQVQQPVEIGDYLDETTLPKQIEQTAPLSNQIEASQETLEEYHADAATPSSMKTEKPPSQHVELPSRIRRKPRRRQINMSPATEEKLNQIVAYVQDYGPQSDAAVSEIMEAIINAHHESLSHMRFGSVRPRGSWGSPTATAFKHALSRAFTKAIVDFYSE